MKVLAKRANGIFIIAPIITLLFILLTICLFVMLADDSEQGRILQMLVGYSEFGSYRYRRGRFFRYFYFGFSIVSLGCVVSAVRRIFIPKVIIEYDKKGLYIYRRFKPVKTIRYEDMWSRTSETDLENINVIVPRFRYGHREVNVSNPFWGIIKTGTLRIETAEEIISLHGIKNVKEVELMLNKLINDSREKFDGS